MSSLSAATRYLPGGIFCRATTLIVLMLLVAAAAGAQTTTTTTSVTDGGTPSGLRPGSPAGSFALSRFDNVNLYNGNLNFRLPLLNVGGRGSAGYAMTLALNLKSWHVRHTHKEWPDGSTTDSFVPTKLGWTPYSGYGAGALTGRSYGLQTSSNLGCPRWYSKTLARLTFSAADGTEYELRDQLTNGQPLTSTCNQGAYRGTVFVTADGTSATFISDTAIYDIPTINPFGPTGFSVSGYLMLRDGTRYRIDGGSVTWIRDRNSNKVSFAYTSNSMTVTDSLNRTVTVNYNVSDVAPYGLCDQIIYGGFGGAQRVIRVSYTDLASALRPGSGYTIKTPGGANGLFPELNGSSSTTYNPTVASSVWLPDGRRYRLYYNSYGELARVELPTGGAVEYDMTPGSGVFCPGPTCSLPDDDAEIYRRMVERRVYPDGSTGSTFEHKDVYSNSETVGTASSTVTVEQISQGGVVLARSRHYFDGSALDSLFGGAQPSGYGAWYEGNERQTDLLDTTGNIGTATVLCRVVTTRAQRAHVSWWPGAGYGPVSEEPPNDPRVIETVTTLEPSGANLVSRQTAVAPDDPTGQTIGFDQYNNPTDTWEYDYGGAFLRRTHTDYVTVPSYVTANVNPAVGASLRSLLVQQWVSSDLAGSNKVSRTDYAYDQSGLTSRAGITGQCPYYDNPGQPKGQCSATGPNGEQPTELTARGNPTGVTRYANAASGTGPVTATSQYDIAGNVVSATDPKGNTATISFADSFCNDGGVRCGNTFVPNTFTFPSSVSSPVPDPTGQYGSTVALVNSTIYDYYTGLTYSTTDANNKVTTLSYKDSLGNLDPLDRLRGVVRPDGGRTDFNYSDAVGNLYVQTLTDLDATRRVETRQYFDGLVREVRSFTWENQDAAKPWLTSDTQYDALGRLWRASAQYRSAGPGSGVNPSSRWVEATFDALGRPTQVKTTADNAATTTSYIGNSVTVTDTTGKARKSVTDALGRLKEVYEDPSGYNYLTSYTYDVLDNLRTVTQGTQPARVFVYDSLSRLTSATNPESGTAGYTYDANGNLNTRTDGRGVTATYTYDNLNRNISITYTNDPAQTPPAYYHYDNTTSGANGLGRFWWSSAGASATGVNGYDAVGRLSERHQNFLNNGVWSADYSVSVTYNKAGGVTSQTYPSGRTVSYNYDAAGRPGDYNGQAAFAGNLGDGTQRTYASEVRYQELGGMEQERFGTATPVYNKGLYNSRGQLAEIRVSSYSLLAPGQETNWNRGAIINHYSANGWGASGGGADNNGNLKKQEVYLPNDDQISGYFNVVQQYGYDALNRLTSVEDKPFNGSPDFYQAYTYDRWGNRTINAGGTWNAPAPQFTVSGATNRLAPPAGYTMTHDAAGNLVFDNYTGAGTRAYDAENRMISAQDYLGQTSSYTYDANGRRVRRRVANGAEVWQVYGIGGALLAEYASGASPSAPQKEYGYRAGELLVVAEPGDHLWVDDAVPAGASQYGDGDSWSWVAGSPAPTSGATSHQSNVVGGLHQHFFAGASDKLTVGAGEKLIVYVYIDPANVPSEVMLQWNSDAEGWNHRAYWGANNIGWGTDGTGSRRSMGALPGAGQWVRLEVPASQVGLEGKTLNGMAFTLYGGRATWDRAGKSSSSTGAGTQWLVSDQLGSPRMVINQSGGLTGVRRHDYFPFGEEVAADATWRTTARGYAADAVRQKFTGYERDSETGLDFAQARYFASAQGRFTGADPLLASARPGAPQTWNRYAYALNNPLRFTDPTGMVDEGDNSGEPPPPPPPQQPPVAPPPIDSSMEGSPEYVEQAGVRQVVDVRQDPAIVNGAANIHGTPLPAGTARVLTDVVPIVGTTTFVYDSAIVDAYGGVTYGYTGTVRPVAYVPVDQGGNPMPQSGELLVREEVQTVSGERATTSGAAPQNASGIFIDIHTTEPGTRPTVLVQQVVVDQVPGGVRPGNNKVSSRVIFGTNKNPNVIRKDANGGIDVKIGEKVKLP